MKDLAALLGDAIRKINSDFALRDLATDLLRPVLRVANARRAIACIWTTEDVPVGVGAEGIPGPVTPEEEIQILLPIMKMAAGFSRIVSCDDAIKDERFRDVAHRTGLNARRLGAAPIFSRGRAIGAVVYYGDEPGALPDAGAAVLAEVAHCLAMAVEVASLRDLAHVDNVTGLPTHRLLLDRLNDEIALTTRTGRTVSLATCALDGEADLRGAAQIIRKHIRPTDVAARVPDDRRFYLLLPETDRRSAVVLAEKIRVALDAAGSPASFGVANVPEDAVDAETLFMTLDDALARARAQGNIVYDYTGPARIGEAIPIERVLAAREGRALEEILRRLFSSDLDLQAQLDMALSLLAATIEAPKAILAVLGPDEWIASSRLSMDDREARDAREQIRKTGEIAKTTRDGDRLAVPILEDGRTLAVIYVDHKIGDYEENVLQALAARMGGELAASVRLQKRRREIRERQETLAKAVAELRQKYDFSAIVGSGSSLSEVLRLVARAAETDAPVLVTGESGTGKELIARAVHANSPRRNQAIVVLNCAAVPAALLESELFGHVKGAFTSAVSDRKGLFETANEGTVFLDEVAEIPLEVQAKLLRAIQFGEIQRVGSDAMTHADVRIVTASNRDLAEEVRRKRFREDLYYRINVFRIHVPPLREHPEDIPALVDHYCRKFAGEFRRPPVVPEGAVVELLQKYTYPGNVRELENILLRAIAMSTGGTLTTRDLPPDILRGSTVPLQIAIPRTGEELEKMKEQATREASDRLEMAFIESAMREAKGNISEAARRTSINRTWLQKLITRHGIRPDDFKP